MKVLKSLVLNSRLKSGSIRAQDFTPEERLALFSTPQKSCMKPWCLLSKIEHGVQLKSLLFSVSGHRDIHYQDSHPNNDAPS